MQTELNALDHRYAHLRQQMRCLELCPDEDVPRIFTEVLDSLERLFAFESQLMDTHHFPAYRCHVEQHARVLGGLHRTHSLIMNGACKQGRHAGTYLLMHWFELHNETLDACLAVWLESTETNRPLPRLPRDALPNHVMGDMTRKTNALWRPSKPAEQNEATSGSRQNGQGPGEQ